MTTSLALSESTEDRKIDRILRAALTEFGRRGFQQAREGLIARMAGVSMATLRHHFPTKEDLFREAVRSTVVSALARVEPGAGADLASAGAVARLREFARWFWNSMEEPGQAALFRLSLGELPRYPELAVFHAIEVMGRAAQRLERTLAEGMDRGEFRVRDTRATARVILAALITHAHWFSYPDIYGGITGPDRASTEASVIAALVEGLGGGPGAGGGSEK